MSDNIFVVTTGYKTNNLFSLISLDEKADKIYEYTRVAKLLPTDIKTDIQIVNELAELFKCSKEDILYNVKLLHRYYNLGKDVVKLVRNHPQYFDGNTFNLQRYLDVNFTELRGGDIDETDQV